jgi:hypothetical protein
MTSLRKRAGPAIIQVKLTTKGIQKMINEVLGSRPVIHIVPTQLTEGVPILRNCRPETHSLRPDIRRSTKTTIHDTLLSSYEYLFPFMRVGYSKQVKRMSGQRKENVCFPLKLLHVFSDGLGTGH